MKKRLFSLFLKFVNLFKGSGLSKIPPVYWLYFRFLRLFRPAGEIFDVDGIRMAAGTAGMSHSYDLAFSADAGGWEPVSTRLFKQVTHEGNVVVDVGAHIGYYTLLAARIVGARGKVYAFEPDPANCRVLSGNVEANGFNNVVIVPKAVSDRTGRLELYLDEKNTGMHSIYRPKKVKRSVVVDSITLDEYFHGMECPISVIKMDIEGAEVAAFSGMRRIIEENKNLKILTEFHPPWVVRAGVSPEDFVSQLLERYHFSITAILDYARPPRSVKIDSTAALFNLFKEVRSVNLLLEKNDV